MVHTKYRRALANWLIASTFLVIRRYIQSSTFQVSRMPVGMFHRLLQHSQLLQQRRGPNLWLFWRSGYAKGRRRYSSIGHTPHLPMRHGRIGTISSCSFHTFLRTKTFHRGVACHVRHGE
ncbi:hypothetical protein LINGRAHAP2_LOCUS32538 [Linum grandiflorum]